MTDHFLICDSCQRHYPRPEDGLGSSPSCPDCGRLLRDSADAPTVVPSDNPSGDPASTPTVQADGYAPTVQSDRPGAGEETRATFSGRYDVTAEIGRGGMGAILDAKDRDIKRDVAIKVMLGDADASDLHRMKFVQEAQIQGQLEHPNICPVHEVGRDETGRYYFTMKKVRGRSLAEILRELRGRASESREEWRLRNLLGVFDKMCDAVAFAHSRGVIHRDLKPDNVMIGEFGEVQVMDWGLARIVGTPDEPAESTSVESDMPLVTRAGSIMGTPSYMAPEQARGEIDRIDERTDIYALGGMLYEILTLQPPVRGSTVEEMVSRAAEGGIPTPSRIAVDREVPRELEVACMKALSKEPDDRYPTVIDFQADIRAYLEGRTLSAVEYSAGQRIGKWVLRNRVFSATAAAALLVLIVATAIYLVNVTRERDRAQAAEQRALTNLDEAQRQRDIAREEKRRAEISAVEAMNASADTLAAAGDYSDAARSYRAAHARSTELGLSNRRNEIGQCALYRQAPPPAAVYQDPSTIIQSCAFTPDGTLLITGDFDGRITIRSAMTGRVYRRFQAHDGAVMELAVSDDGLRLLTVQRSGDLALWSLPEGARLQQFENVTQAMMASISFIPDTNQVMASTPSSEVHTWNAETGELIHKIKIGLLALPIPGTEDVVAVKTDLDRYMVRADRGSGEERWSVDGRYGMATSIALVDGGSAVAVGTYTGNLLLVDIQTGEIRLNERIHLSKVSSIVPVGDGDRIVTSSLDRTARLISLSSGRTERVYAGFSDHLQAAVVSPDASLVAAGGADGTLRLWPLEDRFDLSIALEDNAAGEIALSPDGCVGAAGLRKNGRVVFFDARTGTSLGSFRTDGTSSPWVLEFIDDGKQIAFVFPGRSYGLTRLSDRSGRMFTPPEDTDPLAFSPDGTRVYTATQDGVDALFEFESQEQVWSAHDSDSPFLSAAFSKDGSILFSADSMDRLFVTRLDGPTRTILSPGHAIVDIVPAGRDDRIFVRSYEGVYCRDLEGNLLYELPAAGETIYDFVFGPDDEIGAVSYLGGMLRYWDLESQQPVATVLAGDTVRLSEFSADGRVLLVGMEERLVMHNSRWVGEWIKQRDSILTLQAEAGERELTGPEWVRLGTWYNLHGLWSWADACFRKAEAGGESTPAWPRFESALSLGAYGICRDRFEDVVQQGFISEPWIDEWQTALGIGK